MSLSVCGRLNQNFGFGHAVPSSSLENSTSCLFPNAVSRFVVGSPLLKEKSHSEFLALPLDINDPFRLHTPCLWTALTTDNDPMNTSQEFFADAHWTE